MPTPGEFNLGAEEIARRIIVLRGQRVILDADLAALYGVPTKRLNEQVKRNARRFPDDFCFQLTREEASELARLRSQFATSKTQSLDGESLQSNRSQFATGSWRHRDPRSLPYAFTEHGAVQAANVLNSDTAIEMGVQVVRAFVRLCQWLGTQKAFAAKLADVVRQHGDGVAQCNGATRRHWMRASNTGCPTGRRAQQLEARVGGHDEQLAAVIEALRQLTASPEPTHDRKLGFHRGNR